MVTGWVTYELPYTSALVVVWHSPYSSCGRTFDLSASSVPPTGCATLALEAKDCPEVDGFSEETKSGFAASFTTCFTAFDVLPAKFESPAYTAVTTFVPTGSVEVVKLAEPPLNNPAPRTVLPFMNETVSPSGGVPSLDVTAAVKVMACPCVDGFEEDVSVVVVTILISILATNAS